MKHEMSNIMFFVLVFNLKLQYFLIFCIVNMNLQSFQYSRGITFIAVDESRPPR